MIYDCPPPLKLCTCTWSPVNSATIDPPYVVKIDPDCPRHGEKGSDRDELEEASQ
jgi:hypothetical protein